MMNADYEKAIAMYGNIADGMLGKNDQVLKATAYWMEGEKRQALAEYRKCTTNSQLSPSDLHSLLQNERMQCRFALSDTDMHILVDAIYDKTID